MVERSPSSCRLRADAPSLRASSAATARWREPPIEISHPRAARFPASVQLRCCTAAPRVSRTPEMHPRGLQLSEAFHFAPKSPRPLLYARSLDPRQLARFAEGRPNSPWSRDPPVTRAPQSSLHAAALSETRHQALRPPPDSSANTGTPAREKRRVRNPRAPDLERRSQPPGAARLRRNYFAPQSVPARDAPDRPDNPSPDSL